MQAAGAADASDSSQKQGLSRLEAQQPGEAAMPPDAAAAPASGQEGGQPTGKTLAAMYEPDTPGDASSPHKLPRKLMAGKPDAEAFGAQEHAAEILREAFAKLLQEGVEPNAAAAQALLQMQRQM